MSQKVNILVFTDPMMGLSYESEPILRKLETHFGEQVEFKYLMRVLVRDVYDFVDTADLLVSKEFALERYNARLAKIYLDEELISGMPINMQGFELFSVEETTSRPLNLAYKAAQLADAPKADNFLYNLRYATIVECRPTTKKSEILKVVEKTNIDVGEFLRHFEGETAETALEVDLKFAEGIGIRTLPSYLIEYKGEGALFQGLLGYGDFVKVIYELTRGTVKPNKIEKSAENVRNLLKMHPLISETELIEAFDLENRSELEELIKPLVESKVISILKVKYSFFVELEVKP